MSIFQAQEIPAGRHFRTPIQWTDYCQNAGKFDPTCSEDQAFDSKPIKVTGKMIDDFGSVNDIVNHKYQYTDDIVVDRWTSHLEITLKGDCDDFALTKRRMLIELGYNPAAIQPTVVYTPNGGHMILLINTNQGYYILDSKYDDLAQWHGSKPDDRYTLWVARFNGKEWVNFDEN